MAATICLLGGALLRQFYAKRKAGGNNGNSGKKGSVTYITGSALGALSGGGGGPGGGPGDHWSKSEFNRYELTLGGNRRHVHPPGKKLTHPPGRPLWRWEQGSFTLADLKSGRPHDAFPQDITTGKTIFYDANTSANLAYANQHNPQALANIPTHTKFDSRNLIHTTMFSPPRR